MPRSTSVSRLNHCTRCEGWATLHAALFPAGGQLALARHRPDPGGVWLGANHQLHMFPPQKHGRPLCCVLVCAGGGSGLCGRCAAEPGSSAAGGEHWWLEPLCPGLHADGLQGGQRCGGLVGCGRRRARLGASNGSRRASGGNGYLISAGSPLNMSCLRCECMYSAWDAV